MLAALAWFASENIALSRVAQAGDRMIALQTALLEIGETLRDSRDTQQMALATARIVGRVLSADRAGFASADEAAETFDAETDWTAPGALSVTGRHRLEAYDVYPNRLAHGEPLVVHDAHNDGQTRHDLPGVWPVGVRSLVAMPICENGKTIGVFFVHLAHPRSWPAEEIAFLRSAADRLQAGVVQHGAAQRQRIVNGEIAHRLKNALTMVQAIANQTLRTVTDREAVYAFGRRLVAIGAAHDALLGSDWTQTDLRTVASTVAETAGFADRCALEGPPVMLQPRAALSFSLIVHELLTNACKYGALSNDDGEVSLRWSIVGGGDADDRLVIRWQESGGPPVNEPARSGFGSKLIGIGLVGAGGVSLRYERSGFSAEMQATLHSLARV